MPCSVTGHVIFADDVREEASGRYTIVGAMFGGVELPSYPAVLAKLGISATAYQPLDQHKPYLIRLEIAPVNGEPKFIGEHYIDPSEFPPPDPRTPPPSDGVRKTIAQLNMVLSPLSLEAPSRIRVVALCDGETNLLGEIDFVRPIEGDMPRQSFKKEISGFMGAPKS